MFLKEFYSGTDDCVEVTAEQASLFAKEVAGDFNPLHDVDAKRFCVPGDLLFAIVLEKYGLSKKMHFTFTGMLGHGITLGFPQSEDNHFEVVGSNGKSILSVDRSDEISTNETMIAQFIRDYVAFSGHNFPYVLVPLLAKQNVMINISRPLVIYNGMTLEFDRLDFTKPTIEMLEPELSITGKRGDANLNFQIKSGDEVVGRGFKTIIISSMREYDEQPMQAFVDDYLARKETYLSNIA